MIHARTLNNPKLQRVYKTLQAHGPYSTLDLLMITGLPSAVTIIAELKAHGLDIRCMRVDRPGLNERYFYHYLPGQI